MRKKLYKTILATAIIILTIAGFIYYVHKHPDIIQNLKHTSPFVLLLILFLYILSVCAIGLSLLGTLLLCNVRLSLKEGILLSMYSSIINFFGPLQSGPVFRAIYLKKKHNVKIKDYTLATCIYYVFYAVFSGAFLLIDFARVWLLIAIPCVIIAALVLRYSQAKLIIRIRNLKLKAIGVLAFATLIQVVLFAMIYYCELHAVDPKVHINQAIIYTGAANFSLFVALTPGAIGFREAFLIFSRRLHHIGLATIVSANIIDRFMYIVLMVILVVIIFGYHINDQFKSASKDKT